MFQYSIISAHVHTTIKTRVFTLLMNPAFTHIMILFGSMKQQNGERIVGHLTEDGRVAV